MVITAYILTCFWKKDPCASQALGEEGIDRSLSDTRAALIHDLCSAKATFSRHEASLVTACVKRGPEHLPGVLSEMITNLLAALMHLLRIFSINNIARISIMLCVFAHLSSSHVATCPSILKRPYLTSYPVTSLQAPTRPKPLSR